MLTNSRGCFHNSPLFWECLHLRKQGRKFGLRPEVPVTDLTTALGPGSEGKGLWVALGPAASLGHEHRPDCRDKAPKDTGLGRYLPLTCRYVPPGLQLNQGLAGEDPASPSRRFTRERTNPLGGRHLVPPSSAGSLHRARAPPLHLPAQMPWHQPGSAVTRCR